ncbi:MAG: DNA repair protein RadA [Clostridiales bacterium]|jgi:DNA repair protein RadA/Sms|nr:DNA repair protein RadA [Clostridiales bacterium]
MPQKLKTVYICDRCGYETGRWMGRCPNCGEFGTFVEDVVEVSPGSSAAAASKTPVTAQAKVKAYPLEDIGIQADKRDSTGISELDRVLSGGLVPGSLTLVGGEPGVGKSTLLLQLCKTIKTGSPILYVSGEESLAQIKLRARRLGVARPGLYIMAETRPDAVEGAVQSYNPGLVVIDSIQTMADERLPSAPGSPTQIRECALYLMKLAKARDVSVVIIGHVTKEGAIAGPRLLEHMVDTVLYFEGDKELNYRIVRAVKNRFGSVNEIGVFEMAGDGLAEITNPSMYMLSGRPVNAAGSVVTCAMEGTRPILAEVQALVSRTSFGMPRRVAAGADYNRVVMLIALLEKRAGLNFGNYDCYVNVAGGLRINEPALDMAAVAALASGYRNMPVREGMIIFGEAGLTGEARAVVHAEKRVLEAARLGFSECIVPQANLKTLSAQGAPANRIKILGAANIGEMLDAAIY